MEPSKFEQRFWVQGGEGVIKAPPGKVSIYRENSHGAQVERVCDSVIVDQGLQKKVSGFDVVEECESRPHQRIRLFVLLETKSKCVRVLHVPNSISWRQR